MIGVFFQDILRDIIFEVEADPFVLNAYDPFSLQSGPMAQPPAQLDFSLSNGCGVSHGRRQSENMFFFL